MTDLKNRALEIIDKLYGENRPMEHRDYSVIFDALEEIEPLQNRDKELADLWAQFEDVSMDPETECIEEQFLTFPAGTSREEIWRWFDERHSKGVAYLLYGGAEDYVPEARRLYGLKVLCTECDSESCVFNPHGVCLAPFITGHAPAICDDGCGDYCYKEA